MSSNNNYENVTAESVESSSHVLKLNLKPIYTFKIQKAVKCSLL